MRMTPACIAEFADRAFDLTYSANLDADQALAVILSEHQEHLPVTRQEESDLRDVVESGAALAREAFETDRLAGTARPLARWIRDRSTNNERKEQ